MLMSEANGVDTSGMLLRLHKQLVVLGLDNLPHGLCLCKKASLMAATNALLFGRNINTAISFIEEYIGYGA